jgi:hypothetical protein
MGGNDCEDFMARGLFGSAVGVVDTSTIDVVVGKTVVDSEA